MDDDPPRIWMIDQPEPFSDLETWRHHLADLRRIPAAERDASVREHLRDAEKAVAALMIRRGGRKRTRKTVVWHRGYVFPGRMRRSRRRR